MEKLKYTVIKDEHQYIHYCDILESLLSKESEDLVDEIELLELLIQKWDEEHYSNIELNPVELLKTLMEENQLNQNDLAGILGLTKGTASKILNYQKGFSKETIRKLSAYFKLSQEAFNRPYALKQHTA
ncbi:MAG: helix-turn-helix domain-containing protein [Chitinophagaceae bacterium]|nr:MAG: helix-turn-helix domain-containing protein [Chitinophagaceae bacterium]